MDTTPFPAFARLLTACEQFAEFSGGRYTWELMSDFRAEKPEEDNARKSAMPVVLEYIERLKLAGAGHAELVKEFRVADKMVMQEAVFTSMVSTCRSVDLWPSEAPVASDDITYQDLAEPLEHVAQRLYNYVQLRNQMDEEAPHWRKMFAASFVVEFGRAHGLAPSEPDASAQKMLMDFLSCVKDWGERTRKPALTPNLEVLPTSLRCQAERFWRVHRSKVAFGGAMFFVSAAMLGAGVAAYSSFTASAGAHQAGKQQHSTHRADACRT